MAKRITEILKGSYVTRTSGYLDVIAKEELFKEISAISGGAFTKSHNPGNEVGDVAFDNQYLIHSNDPDLTVRLLKENIRAKILNNSLYTIS